MLDTTDARSGGRLARRRRIAWAFIAYGVVGLLITVASLATVVSALPAIDALDRQRADIVRWLDLATKGIGDAELGMAHAGASLGSAAVSARSAATLSDDLATSMASLRDASGVSVLGSQPFGSLADDFDRVAVRSRALSSSMIALAGSLDADTADFATVSADAAALRLQIADLRDAVADNGSGGFGAPLGRVFAIVLLLLAWLALPAAASVVVGALWLRELAGGPSASA
jgi:hypothetical protein